MFKTGSSTSTSREHNPSDSGDVEISLGRVLHPTSRSMGWTCLLQGYWLVGVSTTASYRNILSSASSLLHIFFSLLSSCVSIQKSYHECPASPDHFEKSARAAPPGLDLFTFETRTHHSLVMPSTLFVDIPRMILFKVIADSDLLCWWHIGLKISWENPWEKQRQVTWDESRKIILPYQISLKLQRNDERKSYQLLPRY